MHTHAHIILCNAINLVEPFDFMGRWLFVIILTKINDNILCDFPQNSVKTGHFPASILVVAYGRVYYYETLRQEIHKFSHTWFVYVALIFSGVSILCHNNLPVIWFGVFFFFGETTTRIHCHKFQTRAFACVGSAVFSFYHKHFGHNRWIGVNHFNTCTDAYPNKDWIKIRLIEFRLAIFMLNIQTFRDAIFQKWMLADSKN